MNGSTSVVAGVEFGDALVASTIRDGVARIENLIDTELEQADEVMREQVVHLLRSGGKRFRPLFTVLSAQLGPEPDAWQVTVAGAVIELVHLATLYHDDVMDEAQMRRTVPSVNARWGNRAAIFAGNYLFASGSRLVSQLGHEAVKLIAETLGQLVIGQMRETHGTAAGINDIDHYQKVVREKTACLIAACGRFGATFSGADHEQIERLERLGRVVGIAFQIVDDIIDITSDPDESGKMAGTDLREGVHTLPVLYAMRETGPAAERLRTLLATPIDTDADLAECLALVRRSGGISHAKATVTHYAVLAREEIAALPPCDGRDALASLLTFTVDRHR